MNHRKETAEIFARILELERAGTRSALATVVRVEGSAYRRPGAKLLVDERGEALGSVSGGCLEADVREVAQQVLASGEPRLRHYDTRSHAELIWGLGLGCEGAIDLFVQAAGEGSLAELAGAATKLLAGEEAIVIVTATVGPAVAGRVLIVRTAGTLGTLGDPALDERLARVGREALAAGQSRAVSFGGGE